MRRTGPLILGAGPAGCAAAIVLAEQGMRPILLDRDAEARDQLCGGFVSWRTAGQLADLGVDPAGLGARAVDRLALFAGDREISIRLPMSALALSRRTLDGALRARALEAGAEFEVDSARGLEGTEVVGRLRRWAGDGLFLATGKQDLRGAGRSRPDRDPALGLRIRLPPATARTALLEGRIELHLFAGGYAGVVLHEDGSANFCLAVRKTLLARCGGDPTLLLGALAKRHPPLAARLGDDWLTEPVETIGAVPYGWIAATTAPGIFRLGDQAAVIPSLAGEGVSIALASGVSAARTWLEHGAAGASLYQRRMADTATPPLRAAGLARRLAESPLGARAGLAFAGLVPAALRWLVEASRVAPDARLAPPPPAP